MSDTFSRSLSDSTIRNAKPKARAFKLADGGGLYLEVMPGGSKLWRYKFRIDGREGRLAIGAYPDIGLAEAREEHRKARALVAAGTNPVDQRRQDEQARDRERKRRELGKFATVTGEWMAATDHNLAASSRAQRRREIDKNLLPVLGERQIEGIHRSDLHTLLKKIDARAPEVARNIRRHLDDVFEYAAEAGLIEANPVPSVKILSRRQQKPLPALDLARIGDFSQALDASGASLATKAAVKLVVLTMLRKNEVIGARWDEFDLERGDWNIPLERMKTRKPHWVPLSHQAVALLKALREADPRGEILFPNTRDPGRPMAGRSLNAVMERLGFNHEATMHGFRSMASTFLNENGWNPDVVERALSHTDRDQVRAAYNRAEYREERRRLLQHWADVIDNRVNGGNVIPGRFGKKTA